MGTGPPAIVFFFTYILPISYPKGEHPMAAQQELNELYHATKLRDFGYEFVKIYYMFTGVYPKYDKRRCSINFFFDPFLLLLTAGQFRFTRNDIQEIHTLYEKNPENGMLPFQRYG